MRKRFLEWYSRVIYRHRAGVLVAALVLSALSGAAMLRLELHTSREGISRGDAPVERAFDAIVDEFGAPDYLIVVVQPSGPTAPPATEYHSFLDELARRLEGESQFVGDILYRLDLDALLEHGLYFLPLEDLRGVVEALEEPRSPLRNLRGVRTLPDANRALAAGIRAGLQGGAAPAVSADAAAGIRRLVAALEWQRRFLDRPAEATAELEPSALGASLIRGTNGFSRGGYLTSRGGEHYFLLARPASSTSDLEFINPFIQAVRGHLSELEARHPGLQAGLTGLPAMVQEEMAAVRRDTWLTTAVAALGIIMLATLAFHRKRLAPLVLVSLAMGVIWAGALISLAIGYLNLITSTFAVILIGLGIDFGVHIVSQYEIEVAEGRCCADAIGAAIRKTGSGLLAGAMTTAAAFFSITLMEFPGFAQLGFVGGWGILLCLLAMFTALPALLCLEGERRERGGGLAATGGKRLQAGDRFSRGLLRFPTATLVAGVALTAWLGYEARQVRFDQNIQNLLPAQADSLRLQETVLAESDLSPDFAMVMAEDLEELARLQARNPEAATIARRESLLGFLPADQAHRGPLLGRLRQALDDITLGEPPARAEGYGTDLAASLAEAEAALVEVEDLAFSSGRVDLLEAAGAAREAAAAAAEAAAGATPEQVRAWRQAERDLFRRAGEILSRIKEMAAADPPRPEDLPETLRQRFVGRTGKYLLYLYPDGKLAEPGAMERFIADCRAISPEATGYPLLVHEGTRRIIGGFDRVVLLGMVLSAAALLIDFRHVGYALMAAATTGLGMTWMFGLMGVAGVNFSMANLPAVPLVLGTGVAYGIHVLHRYRLEGDEGLPTVLHHTGRAILISALTTMIGFGSMALASHRGIASLGIILLFGIGSCFVSAIVLLPSFLDRLGRIRGAR